MDRSNTASTSRHAPSVDPAEVARFDALATEWWDANGKFAPLHRFNPARLTFLKDALLRHFQRDNCGQR